MSCGATLSPPCERCAGCGIELPSGARFCPGCGKAKVGPPSSQAVGERRHLTVMFCDLVGSTPLAQRLDPEDVREVIGAYQSACEEAIRRYEGHVAQYLGDGLLVYFGFPIAHEDDAQRAVRAALAMLEALEHLNQRLGSQRRPRLSMRIGVHSGPIVVDVASGETQVFGHTMNLAARLQGIAEPDTAVISEETLRLVSGLFTVRALGPQSLKGIDAAVKAYQILQSTGIGSAADLPNGLTPLVGREQELGLLLDRWRQVQEGRGQVVVVSSEAGMGKSRLVHGLREHLQQTSHRWLQCRGSPYHADSALHPVLELLRQGLFFHEEDGLHERHSKLERALRVVGFDVAEMLPFFAPLLGLPLPEGCAPSGLSPDAHRRRTLEALARWMLVFAERQPVVAVVEDLHWIDPSTLELVSMLVDQAPVTSILIVLTTRPAGPLAFAQRANVGQLALGPLTRAQIVAMVQGMLGDRQLPAVVLDQLVSKTDGVPIFVEELTKMVVESGLLRARDRHYELAGPLPPLAIPTTLQDSLMARLDRLAPVKGVAQVAAVLGREFSYELLRAVAELDDAPLADALRRLVDAELLYPRGVGTRASYTFRHALIQESAYASLLKSTRQRVHQRTAVTLMQRFPETALEQPELLAHHLEQAGALSEAIDQLALAGTRATARSAHVESARLFERALELLAQTPPGVARDQREVSLQLGLAPPLITTRGYASEAAEHLLRRAHALAANVGDLSSRFAVARGLAIYHASRAEYGRARPFAEQCRALADQAGSPELFLGASAPLIHTSFFVGDLPATLEVCERVAALYDPARHGQLAYQLGEDPGVVCAVYRALALQLAGRGAEALAAQTVAERLAAAFDNPTSQAIVQIYTGWLHQIREEPAEALARAERALAITDRQALHFWGWFASLLRGWARGASRDPGAELGQMRRSLASWQGAGTRIGCSAFLLWIADLERRAGHLADAARSAAEAREHAEKSGERHVLSEILRLEGELAAALDPSDPVQAEQTLRASLAAAESQAAWFYALRSATSLARERAARGRPEEARSLLELHVSRFAAEPGFPELCAARELLALL